MISLQVIKLFILYIDYVYNSINCADYIKLKDDRRY